MSKARSATWGASIYGASLAPGGPRTRFVIVCLPRSGSELLVDLLDQLPEVRCEGEIMPSPVRRPIPYLRGRARIGARGAGAWGCKILLQQLHWYEASYGPSGKVLRDLVAAGWHLVHLRREGVLASALSAVQAEQSGRWHATLGEQPVAEPVDSDPATLLSWLHTFDVYQSFLDGLVADLPHLDVAYERDLIDAGSTQATVDRLAAAMGTPSAPVHARLKPFLPSDPFDRLADPEPFKALLRLTRFAHLVDG